MGVSEIQYLLYKSKRNTIGITPFHNYIPDANSLAHHGILGQKWGIRRYQNYDGTLTSLGKDRYANSGDRVVELKKGTTVYRTTVGQNDNNRETKYVTYHPIDRDMYKGHDEIVKGYALSSNQEYQNCMKEMREAISNKDFETASKIRTEAGRIASAQILYEHEYTLTDDLKIPDTKEATRIVSDIISGDPKIQRTVAKFSNRQLANQIDNLSDDQVSRLVKSKNDSTNLDAFFWSLGSNEYNAKVFFSALKQEGYNAVTDYAGVGGRSDGVKEGIQPLIVLYSDSLLKEISSIPVSEFDSQVARKDYDTWYNSENTARAREKRRGSI